MMGSKDDVPLFEYRSEHVPPQNDKPSKAVLMTQS